ncbi:MULTISPECIES: TauD/TfdA family dioxygenase [Pseudomonas]
MGGAVLAGRNRKVLETLKTLRADEAPLSSLSRFSGESAQPWHIDGSHLPIPPRYLILGCHSINGAGAPPTQLLRVKDAGFPLLASRRETFTVKNGRSSFYSTIASTDRTWIRFDPACMTAQTEQGRTIFEALESPPVQPCLTLEWTAGLILLVDNWTVLHRRGNASGMGHRTLLRISLKDWI